MCPCLCSHCVNWLYCILWPCTDNKVESNLIGAESMKQTAFALLIFIKQFSKHERHEKHASLTFVFGLWNTWAATDLKKQCGKAVMDFLTILYYTMSPTDRKTCRKCSRQSDIFYINSHSIHSWVTGSMHRDPDTEAATCNLGTLS